MVHIAATPAAGYHFVTNGVEDEGDDAHGVDTQFPWEAHPVWNHSHTIHLPAFWMDRFPVTVDEYAEYLRATHYRPKDRINWLGTIAWDWAAGEPRPKAGAGRQPVTFVGLSEARRYCAWRGARLPQSYEWQWAAQGSDGRLYPWGNGTDPLRHPKPVDGPHDPVPADVDAHPRGRSAFGVEDMVGKCVPGRRPLRKTSADPTLAASFRAACGSTRASSSTSTRGRRCSGDPRASSPRRLASRLGTFPRPRS